MKREANGEIPKSAGSRDLRHVLRAIVQGLEAELSWSDATERAAHASRTSGIVMGYVGVMDVMETVRFYVSHDVYSVSLSLCILSCVTCCVHSAFVRPRTVRCSVRRGRARPAATHARRCWWRTRMAISATVRWGGRTADREMKRRKKDGEMNGLITFFSNLPLSSHCNIRSGNEKATTCVNEC